MKKYLAAIMMAIAWVSCEPAETSDNLPKKIKYSDLNNNEESQEYSLTKKF